MFLLFHLIIILLLQFSSILSPSLKDNLTFEAKLSFVAALWFTGLLGYTDLLLLR